jgi:hypothetical protein
MALMLKKYPIAKEIWDMLVAEMTKKPKIVVTSIQRQLHNIKCSEEDNLHEHLDKAQDLYAHLKERSIVKFSSISYAYLYLLLY